MVTAFSHFSCGSTPAPSVNKPASQPSQPVSLPDNNNNCKGNFKGSRGIATFNVIFPSRFQWRERKHGCDVWSFIWSFEFNSLSGILELRYSLLYLPVFRYACCVLDYFNLHLIWWSFGCLYSSCHVLRKLACSGWGALTVARPDLCPPRFQASKKLLWWVLAMLQSFISLLLKILAGLFVDLADLLPDNIRAQEVEPQAFLERKLVE